MTALGEEVPYFKGTARWNNTTVFTMVWLFKVVHFSKTVKSRAESDPWIIIQSGLMQTATPRAAVQTSERAHWPPFPHARSSLALGDRGRTSPLPHGVPIAVSLPLKLR